MTLEMWLAFVVVSSIVLVIPGPTILTVISYSVVHGRRANIPLVAGVALGDSTALFFSMIGLGSLLAASALWFTVLKCIGGIYLLYLGIKIWRSGVTPMTVDAVEKSVSPWLLFRHSYLVTALNPKSIVFFIAFLPQFINHQAPVLAQMWILAVTFVVLAAINAALYAVFASTVRNAVMAPSVRKKFNLAGGGLLVAAGIWALLARRAT